MGIAMSIVGGLGILMVLSIISTILFEGLIENKFVMFLFEVTSFVLVMGLVALVVSVI